MLDLITSFLIQNHKCELPSIGVFNIRRTSSEIDSYHNKIHPPVEEIIFREEDTGVTLRLVSYISRIRKIDTHSAEESLKLFCTEMREILNGGGTLELETLGSLQKNDAGNVYFKNSSVSYFHSLPIEIIKRSGTEHEIPGGDKEVPSMEMSEYRDDPTQEKKSNWKMWALLLALIAIAGIMYHYSVYSYAEYGVSSVN
jgi:nucleoid DNA-binding protein